MPIPPIPAFGRSLFVYALLPLAVQGFRQPLFWLRSGFVYRIRPGFVYPLRFGVGALQASTPVPVLFTVCGVFRGKGLGVVYTWVRHWEFFLFRN